MPKVTVFNQTGSEVGDIELADSVFGIEPNESVLHDAVVMQQASLRQGTHKTKGRSEVRGGGRKPWRQKGTGRARQGSIRSPQWVGGGVVFGPTPRGYSFKLPKKVRRLAIKSALSSKVQASDVVVLEDLKFDAIKTKDMADCPVWTFNCEKALVVVSDYNENVELSSRNLQNVTVLTADAVNVLDVLKHDKLVLTKAAVEKVEEVLA